MTGSRNFSLIPIKVFETKINIKCSNIGKEPSSMGLCLRVNYEILQQLLFVLKRCAELGFVRPSLLKHETQRTKFAPSAPVPFCNWRLTFKIHSEYFIVMMMCMTIIVFKFRNWFKTAILRNYYDVQKHNLFSKMWLHVFEKAGFY